MANNDSLDGVFHALSDPTRRAVVQRLGEGEAAIGALFEPFDMALPSFMKHIGVLEAAGLIKTVKKGRVRTCTLKRGALTGAAKWLGEQEPATAQPRPAATRPAKARGEDAPVSVVNLVPRLL